MSALSKAYSPAQVEERLYAFWAEKGLFTPRIDPAKKPFVIIMPPPNVTGELHLGHALTATVEDIMARWHRMRGEPTLWLPGTDHAGIATQVVVERELAKEGLTRHQLGRERFLERVWQWVEKYGNRIDEQHKRLGASCDWTRRRFTLDPGPSKAVRHTFVNLYRKGLIYRGERIINWCPRCATALSDLEVEHVETQGNLYYIRYPLEDGKGQITVATTRPETLLGDTAVAINPNDERYRGLVGKHVLLPVLKRPVPVIADEAVDPRFGTGALKITPGHDPTDFDVGQRHNLPIITCIDTAGKMTREAGPYQGQDRSECRKHILEDLRRDGLLERIEPYHHAVGHCLRCRQTVEPLVSQQWFLKVGRHDEPDSIAGRAYRAVKDGDIRIIPERFTKVYLNWLENIRDWCISRQLWWGHRIPVWYCGSCQRETVEYQDPSRCAHCGSGDIAQDPDVLDTWFSSALWPHSTLGWPDDTQDMGYFYPTSVMETGYDILFFWVARMIMLGLENTGKIPFHTVYLHGLVRDVEGAKMSKTRGNVIDPLETISTYGCDALRFALSTGNAPGNDLRLGPARLEAGRNFANKLWNASRFVILGLQGADLKGWSRPRASHLEDRWVLSRLHRLTSQINNCLQEYQFGEAEQAIYEFLWDEYCDWYIEMAKVRLRANPSTPLGVSGMPPLGVSVSNPLPVLAYVLEKTLRLLHPFMPFVTEEVWQNLVGRLPREISLPESLAVASYPETDARLLDSAAEEQVETVKSIVRAVRNVRTEFRIEPRKPIEVYLEPGDALPTVQAEASAIQALGTAEPLHLLKRGDGRPASDQSITAVAGKTTVFIPLGGLVDLAAERRRLEKELAECATGIQRLEARLHDQQFLGKAPEEVVERERERLQSHKERQGKLRELLSQLPR